MNQGYAYTTVKKVYNLLTDYFRYLTHQELISKNPMAAAPMIKKANFMATQGKENKPTFEPGGNRAVQNGGHENLEQRRTDLSAIRSIYSHAQYRSSHRGGTGAPEQ